MPDYLHLHLEAPLMSMGAAQGNWLPRSDDIASQAAGVPPGLGLLPGRPLLTGLIANALGYDRSEGPRHQVLSDRLRFAAAVLRLGRAHDDFQSAALRHDDRGWTTRGAYEGRRGGVTTYESSHIMRKLSWADGAVIVAIRMVDEGHGGEDLPTIAAALDRPERPLFLGRKAYLPSSPIYRGTIDAGSAHDAILSIEPAPVALVWDRHEGPGDAPVVDRDDRGWRAGVYQGEYPMHYRLSEDFHPEDI